MSVFQFYPIYRREMKSYLTSPTIYLCVALFFFMGGLIFSGTMIQFSEASSSPEYRMAEDITSVNFTSQVVTSMFFALTFLMLFLVPIFTMRLIAEEKKSGTFELLSSLPFTDWNIVLAKFLSAYTIVGGMVLLSGYFGIIMLRFGEPEVSVMLVGLFGMLLTSAAFTAIGLFASSLTENQIVAAIVSLILLLAFYLMDGLIPPSSTGFSRLLTALSMRYHTDQFGRGLLRLEDVVYFIVLTGTFLFLTSRVLEIRRWKL